MKFPGACALFCLLVCPTLALGQQDQSSDETPSSASAPEAQVSGGAKLSSEQVSSLPLNKRDFSQLLTLATGTTTDANGASNFTQQLAING